LRIAVKARLALLAAIGIADLGAAREWARVLLLATNVEARALVAAVDRWWTVVEIAPQER
jgi:hypothetical protein